MKKVTVTLPEANGGKWGSLKTKFAKDSGEVKFVDFTGTSKNFDTDKTGAITKVLGGDQFNPSTFAGIPKDLYEAIFADGTRYLLTMANGVLKYSTGGGILTTITSGFNTAGNMEFASYQDRIYFGNGIDNPQSLDKTVNYGGVAYAVPQTKQMGALVPTAPSAALVVTGTGNVPLNAHTYKVTYLYYDLEESNGSAASGVVTADGTHKQVTVTIPVGGYGVTARKIYRDDNDGNWLLLGTVSNNTATTYTDNSATGTSAVPTDNGLPPLFSIVRQHQDRLWADGVSASSSTLYYSEPGMPDIFGSTNYIVCNPRDPIVGFIPYSGKILIFNRNSMGWILGKTKDTYRYEEIPSSVGCVDIRSIQIRTTSGVPTVIWLSSKGLYEFNGGSIDYISENIQDQLNVNIQQASQVKGKNTQDTTSDFTAGTASPAIVISGGIVTQPNPKRVWDDEGDWEGGSSLTNVATNDGNVIAVPTKLVASYTVGGTFSTVVQSGGGLVLPTRADYTGETRSGGAQYPSFGFLNTPNYTNATQRIAVPFIPTNTGTMTNVNFVLTINQSVSSTWYAKVWADSSGIPGTELYSTSVTISTTGSGQLHTFNIATSFSMTGGTKYWVGIQADGAPDTSISKMVLASSAWSGGANSYGGSITLPWQAIEISTGSGAVGAAGGTITYTTTAVASSGTWTSDTYDSFADSAVAGNITHTGTFPAGTGSTTTIQASNDSSFLSGIVSQDFSVLNGTSAVTLSNKRYWRVRINLTTTDDRSTPTVGAPTLTYATTATWISEVIDHTTDITALNSLTMVNSLPAGTTAAVTMATSSDNISYSSYTAIGSAVVARYSKVKVVLTSDGANALTPQVTSVTLKWTLVSSLTSSAIDTGAPPVGWELFTAAVGSSGTLTFGTRTATTSGGLSGAFTTQANRAFIVTTANEFIQWKATFTATADNVPTLDSVVVNWFISATQSIRVASIFDGLAYYLTAAEFGQTMNNIVFKYDMNNNFRVYRDVNINCLSYFFNDIYYGSASEGRLVHWLTGLTNQGVNIAMDVQSAGINYGDTEHTKILRKVYITGKNTGATYTFQYSSDLGMTWVTLINPRTGSSTYTTTSDGSPFKVRMQPAFASNNATGASHIIRILSNDAFECEIRTLKIEAWIRQGEPV